MKLSAVKSGLENAGIRQGDIIVVALLLAFSLVLMCFGSAGSINGSAARICVDGRECAVLSLSQDVVYTVPGGAGNVVEISGGKVRMLSAGCPDGSCIRQGQAHRLGECIVCLPARITVTIISDEASNGLDAVAY